MGESSVSSRLDDPDRGSEEYLVALERRVAEQRKEIRVLHERLRDGDEGKVKANRAARNRIARLERIIGIQAEKLQNQYDGLEALRGIAEAAVYELGQEIEIAPGLWARPPDEKEIGDV